MDGNENIVFLFQVQTLVQIQMFICCVYCFYNNNEYLYNSYQVIGNVLYKGIYKVQIYTIFININKCYIYKHTYIINICCISDSLQPHGVL